MSTGRKSIAFISSTQTNTVSAAGATNVLRSPWKMPFTWSSTKLEQQLDERLALARARPRSRRAPPTRRSRSRRSRAGSTTDERVDVERPEAAVAERLRAERQVVTDVLGGGELFAGGHRLSDSVTRRARKTPCEKISTVTTNDAENAPATTSLVVRQHEPQQDHDQADLDRLGPQARDQNPPCGLRALPLAATTADTRPAMMLTAPPSGRGKRAVHSSQNSAASGNQRRWRRPASARTVRIGLLKCAKHGAFCSPQSAI